MQPRFAVRSATGKRVAVVGSGPCGLGRRRSAESARAQSVTVFEQDDRAGGLLMYGIPNMKLDKKIVERRIRPDGGRGRCLPYRHEGGREDVSADEDPPDSMTQCCFAAAQVSPGTLKLPGRDAEGVYFAVDFLTRRHHEHLLDVTPGQHLTQRANGWSSWAAAIRETTA